MILIAVTFANEKLLHVGSYTERPDPLLGFPWHLGSAQ